MADKRGGARDPDYRTRQPSATGGARTDMQDGSQPVRVATGQPYGERKALEGAQQAVPLPREGSSPASRMRPAPRRPGVPKMLGKHGSLRPDQPISAGRDKFSGQGVPVSRQVLTQALETIIRSSDVVPVGLMQLRDAISDVP